MNTNNKPTPGAKASGHSAHISHSGNAILLEKLSARKSTPDSEALASSDDEGDVQRTTFTLPVTQQKPVRRSSWLNDTQSGNQLRKPSFSTMQPTSSNTNSSADASNMSSVLTSAATASGVRAHPGPVPLWSQGIWGADNCRKDASSRLAEVLPSPTSMYPPGSGGGGFYEANSQGAARSRDHMVNPNIPFAIPLQPTLKTIRSQSYSVGQQEYEVLISPGLPGSAMASTFAGRNRQHSALQHRPSRPSMLSEVSNENGLSYLREVEDDDDQSTTDGGSTQGGVGLQAADRIEALTRENAMLRQQQQKNQSVRPRVRAPTVSAAGANYMITAGRGVQESLMEESEYAVDENDELAELQDMTQRGFLGRRMSEYSAGQGMPQHMSIENRKLESLKKGAWSSSLGFDGLSEGPQSRRHSFADAIGTNRHQAMVGSIGDSLPSREASDENSRDVANRYHEGAGQITNDPANSYFTSGSTQPFGRASEALVPTHASSSSFLQPNVYTPSAMYNQYGHGMHAMSQPRRDQPLYVVLFKCSRSDVFYVQEGTGLQVKPGDLCIVEADRGTDLGTVAHHNLTWAEAKAWKEKYAEEHYKWLMMYSLNAGNDHDALASCAGLMASGNGTAPSAIGGMGPQSGAQEPTSGELKPKIIKRVAQPHEIQALREKEGNEAKAKRMCMQKVKEHGLKMEILDAEFQVDLKKLTFYYFAEAYVNFNLLVTDLFKVYKTRIWMSAINPASFANPSIGLQAPSGVGPGAVGVRNVLPDRRTQQQDQAQQYGGRNYDTGYNQSYATGGSTDRSLMPPPSYPPQANEFGYGYPGYAPRNMNYNPAMMQQMDLYPNSGYSTPSTFQPGPGRYPSLHGGGLGQDNYARQNNGGDAYISNFQGLSLNTTQ